VLTLFYAHCEDEMTPTALLFGNASEDFPQFWYLQQ